MSEQPRLKIYDEVLKEDTNENKLKSSRVFLEKQTNKPNRRIFGFCCDWGCSCCGLSCGYDSCCA